MDMGRIHNQRQALLKDQSGQSMVEYILLLAVVISIVSVVFSSDTFRSYFGDGGKLAEAFRGKIEYTYTHGVNGKEFFKVPNYDNHDSYNGRFFAAQEVYPK